MSDELSLPTVDPVASLGFQSVLLAVAEAEALVRPFRRDGDWSSAHGVPAHVTLAGPWPLAVSLPIQTLGKLASMIRGTRYTLATVSTLEDAICLFPADDAAILDWRARILDAVGVPDETDQRWRPHLTICRSSDHAAVETVEHTMNSLLPLPCQAQRLLVARMISDSQVTVRPL